MGTLIVAAAVFAAAALALRSMIRSRKNAASTTTGTETERGDHPMAMAMDSAPKDTWDKPSPIMEYRFSTRLTPKREAQREIRIPPTKENEKNG